MNKKIIIGTMLLVVAISTGFMLYTEHDTEVYGIDGDTIWFYTSDDTYVEMYGNMSDTNWTAIDDWDSIQEHYADIQQRYGE